MDDTTLNRSNGGGAPRNEPLYPSGKGAGRNGAAPGASAAAAQPSTSGTTPGASATPTPNPSAGASGTPEGPWDAAGKEDSLLGRLAAEDEARPGFPGEHWLALGLGVALLIYAARRGRGSPLLRSLATTAGTGLIARAASGRDGLRSLVNS